MIPKIIHYCWFGGNPLPPLAIKCINSWKKFFPNYEIKEWNENNFNISIVPYVEEAYKTKKYAFVSDYARYWILYHEGGLYFDTDVEVIRPMNDIIEKGAFLGSEYDSLNIGGVSVNPGLGMGAGANLPFYKQVLDHYATVHFIKDDGSLNLTTIVDYTTMLLEKSGLKHIEDIQKCCNIYIYPKDYFSPLCGKYINFTRNTRSIHHYMTSWQGKSKAKSYSPRIIIKTLLYKFAIIKERIVIFLYS